MAETGGATLRRWLLDALHGLGGAAQRPEVHAMIEELYGSTFTPEDLLPRRGRPADEAAWRNNVDSMYDRLKKEGLCEPSRMGDPWRLSHVGAEAAGRSPRLRNPPWSDEELILALDLYLREGILDDSDERVLHLSSVLNALPIHADRPDAARFRNPNGVALKLANFASLDPGYGGKGMSRGGKRDAEIWRMFAGNEDALTEAAADVEARRDWRTARPTSGATRPSIVSGPIEAVGEPHFQVQRRAITVEAERREQQLVHDYAKHLEGRQHEVRQHAYQLETLLRCDLFDETDAVLYEAKGDLRRESIRMAVGQLLDYARLEPARPRLAVLLPRRPSADLLAFVRSAGIYCVHRDENGGWGGTLETSTR